MFFFFFYEDLLAFEMYLIERQDNTDTRKDRDLFIGWFTLKWPHIPGPRAKWEPESHWDLRGECQGSRT